MTLAMKSDNRSSKARSVMIENLEARQFLSGTTVTAAAQPVLPLVSSAVTTRAINGRISVKKSTLYCNDPLGGSKGPSVTLTIKNIGTGPLSLTGASIGGTNATQFVIVTKPGGAFPYSLAAGASTTMTLAFNPPTSTAAGVKTASLSLTSNDPTKPTLVVALRGLATLGTGGQLEPSLQRILDLYQIGVRTGDSNPATTYLFSNSEHRGANDEVTGQLLKKSGTGSVTIQPLATFAGGSPAAVVGWYASGNPSSKHQLLTVSSSTAQSVNPQISGVTSFDPGSGAFGMYTQFPFLSTTQYSQDSLNTAELTVKRKIRFFPLKQNGATVANAYVFTTEDYNNDRTGGTDSNDFVGIIRNVKIA